MYQISRSCFLVILFTRIGKQGKCTSTIEIVSIMFVFSVTYTPIKHISNMMLYHLVFCVSVSCIPGNYVSDIDIRHLDIRHRFVFCLFYRYIASPSILVRYTHQVRGRGGRLVRRLERNLAVRRIFGVQHRLLHHDGRRRRR